MNSKEESIFDVADCDLPFFYAAPHGVDFLELTENQIQEIEENAERFYLALADAL